MTFLGLEGVKIKIVCSYNSCYKKKQCMSTVYQQHHWYLITKRKGLTYPSRKFTQDLEKKLVEWKGEGFELVVCLDANEDIYKKGL